MLSDTSVAQNSTARESPETVYWVARVERQRAPGCQLCWGLGGASTPATQRYTESGTALAIQSEILTAAPNR
jgi:hypothetical protein